MVVGQHMPGPVDQEPAAQFLGRPQRRLRRVQQRGALARGTTPAATRLNTSIVFLSSGMACEYAGDIGGPR